MCNDRYRIWFVPAASGSNSRARSLLSVCLGWPGFTSTYRKSANNITDVWQSLIKLSRMALTINLERIFWTSYCFMFKRPKSSCLFLLNKHVTDKYSVFSDITATYFEDLRSAEWTDSTLALVLSRTQTSDCNMSQCSSAPLRWVNPSVMVDAVPYLYTSLIWFKISCFSSCSFEMSRAVEVHHDHWNIELNYALKVTKLKNIYYCDILNKLFSSQTKI